MMNAIEDLFFTAIENVFSNSYFGYMLVCKMEIHNSFRMVFLINRNESPFTLDLKKKGINLNVRILEFVLYYREREKRRIKMIVTNAEGRLIIMPVYYTFGELVLNSYQTRSTSKISNYLIKSLKN